MGHIDDKDFIESGLLARGKITECRQWWALSTGTQNQVHAVVCKLTVEVELEDRPVYTAECKYEIPMPYLPPGANLPAKRRGDIDDGVSIDWAFALKDR